MNAFTSGKISRDPQPYEVGSPIDGRTLRSDHEPSVPVEFCDYAPRPEFDNHNPILIAFRQAVSRYGYDTALFYFDETAGHGDETSEQVAHAGRVLDRLAALS